MKKNERLKAPAHLSKPAAEWWQKIVTEWDLDDAALLILQSGLEAFDRMKQAQSIISEHGLVAKDRFGQLKANPAVLIERDSRSAMLTAFAKLHLDIEPLHDRAGRPSMK